MKSAITASIGTPDPAIRMPVCPVARKSAATPRRAVRARSPAWNTSCRLQSVPTVSSGSRALAPGAERQRSGRFAHVEQRKPGGFGAARRRIAGKPGVQARGDSSPARRASRQKATVPASITPPALA
jgi:hypothetical protein